MFITGPDVVKTVTGEEVTFEELGGAATHAAKSGVAPLHRARRGGVPRGRPLPALVPAAEQRRPAALRQSRPTRPGGRTPSSIRRSPTIPTKPYDMKSVISRVVDDGDFLEVHERWAENIVCCFARLGGYPVGVVGNQPRALAGVLDIDSVDEGGALRPDLRCVQHSAGHLRRRPRIPTRRPPRSGAGSSATARSCSTPIAEATVPKLDRDHRARRTAARTTS